LLRRLYWSPALGRALESEIGKFDVVHLHSIFLWPTWVAARAARKAGVPYVLSPRGMLIKNLMASSLLGAQAHSVPPSVSRHQMQTSPDQWAKPGNATLSATTLG
jgi:hypothetical protein